MGRQTFPVDNMLHFEDRIDVIAFIQLSCRHPFHGADDRNGRAFRENGGIEKRFSDCQEPPFGSETIFRQSAFFPGRPLQNLQFGAILRSFPFDDRSAQHDRSPDIFAGSLLQIRKTYRPIDLVLQLKRNAERLCSPLNLVDGFSAGRQGE